MASATEVNTEQLRDQALVEQANKASKMIWVTFRKEGIHKYPAAIDDPKLATGEWDAILKLQQKYFMMIEIQSLYNLKDGQKICMQMVQ